MFVTQRQIEFAEEQIFLERLALHAKQVAELCRWRHAHAWRHGGRRFELLALVGHEEVHAVTDDRPAYANAILILIRLRFFAALFLDRVGAAPVFRSRVPESLDFELIGAGARHRNHCRAAQLIVLSLVVRRDDLVLIDAELRKRIPADRVCPPTPPRSA